MSATDTIFNAIHAAVTSNNYRAMQKALKAARSKGFKIKIKLNAKKGMLIAECWRKWQEHCERKLRHQEWKRNLQTEEEFWAQWAV